MSRTDPALETPVLPSLTGLRWVAAFGVFAYHVRNLRYFDGNAQTTLSAVVGSGDTGVSLFFMLSGFVLAWSDRTDGDSAGPLRAALHFWYRRAARIWPLHLVAVLAAIVVGATLMPSIRTTSPVALVANVLLVNAWHAPWWQAGNPVSWSLACEAFFYLTFRSSSGCSDALTLPCSRPSPCSQPSSSWSHRCSCRTSRVLPSRRAGPRHGSPSSCSAS
nr:acyltransferase [Curtobacterium flaccumfaciens]